MSSSHHPSRGRGGRREASLPIDVASTSSSSYLSSPSASRAARFSPALGTSPTSSSYGSSPKLGSASTASAAKSWYAKMKYSDLYDTSDIEVGFLKDEVGEKRRSGMGAWSERVQSVIVDLPFEEFAREVDSYKKTSAGDVGGEGGRPQKHNHFHRVNPRSYSCSPLNSLMGGLSVRLAADESRYACTEDVLPDEAWLLILEEIGVKELCVVCSVSKHLNGLVHSSPYLWMKLYKNTFGIEPETEWSAKVVKHVLCKSERSASKWLDAKPSKKYVGFKSTAVLTMDDSHAISGDGQNLRVWVHKNDRRIKTLKGHTANISCIGFDTNHISSGDVTGHLKLWSMDELRNIRSLRAHADTVSDTLHFQTLCITCSLDGFIKVWDAAQAHPLVLTLEGNARLYNMCMHGARNRLYSVGSDIVGWDLETAQPALRIREDETMITDPDEYYGYPVDVWPGTGNCSKALANNGNLLASAGKGIVNVYDIRTSERCCTWDVGEGFDRDVQGDVTGLDLDDWKLVVGFKGREGIGVYDVRSASSGSMKTEPVMELRPPERSRRIACFGVFDSYAVAGLEGDHQCYLWNFDQTHVAEGGSDDDDEARHAHQSRKQKKKKGRCAKERKKYPKRTTR
ncbi:hypothetical protein A3770_08p50900 [Chloropicon primus]|uniref:F-box domain-containing protein n=1 Tax=Chloropicon primus TaxID=1764295 RepID=A0A5B8MT61_9CHLO|nr:hypothetical protein A3770_08p50900 [Chloropicon primus]|eukprot:QDZ22572.1 hypothetical protein A3770_08p50900 [Chloropicon primus]